MALIAWLLNGDLNNYGIGAVTVTNHGATLDNTCKTGKGYNFASNTYIDATIPSITGNFTVAWWEYSTNFNNSTMPWGIQIFNPFYIKCLNTGDGVDNPWYKPGTTTAIDNISNNVWHHFAVTGNGSVNYLYIDGSLYGQSKIYKKLNSTTLRFNGWPCDTNYKRNGKLCDWRLYNTCLSADQIKEISRGMVLHYKMCQPERSENLLSGSNITQTGAGIATGLSCDFRRIPVGSKFTLSIDIHCKSAVFSRVGFEPSPGGNYLECWLYSSDSGASNFNGRLHKVYTMTSSMSVNDMGQSGIYIQNLTSGTITIGHPKIEIGENPNPQWSPAPSDNPNWGTIEYDGSGFKNHGTVSGNVTLSADSPRYTGSYKFIPNAMISTPGIVNFDKCTYSVWCKDPNMSYKIVFCDGTSKVAFGENDGFLCSCGSNPQNKFTKNNWKNSDWNHVVVVRDGSTYKMYINGEAETQYGAADYWNHSASTITVGGREENAAMWNGNISDFRIYATALDATDVAELYKLGR